MVRVMTVGHSVLTLDAFVALVRAHGVTLIADVRRIPGSRRHPHFARDALQTSLPEHGLGYEHIPGLGGRRTPRADSPHTGWEHPSFRAYADHMATPEFYGALEGLLTLAAHASVAIMCAEAQWWRCHRRLIADALVARGIEVQHIMTAARAPRHELTSFARLEGERVSYPAGSPPTDAPPGGKA